MSQSDFTLRILSVLDGTGFAKAKTEVAGLAQSAEKAGAAAAQGAFKTGRAISDSGRVLGEVLTSGRLSMETLFTIATNFGGAFMKLIPVVGAFFAGWKVGGAIFEKLWNWVVPKVEEFKNGMFASREEMEKLNAVKLDGLKGELDTIDSKLEAIAQKRKGLEQKQEVEQASFALQAQQIEGMPEGPAKERAKKALAYRKEQSASKAKIAAATLSEEAAAQGMRETGAALSPVQQEFDAARADYESYVVRIQNGEQIAPAAVRAVRNRYDTARTAYNAATESAASKVSGMQAQGAAARTERLVAETEQARSTLGYNQMRGKEYGIPDAASGLAAVSGIGANFAQVVQALINLNARMQGMQRNLPL
jgi:hypothetical protein